MKIRVVFIRYNAAYAKGPTFEREYEVDSDDFKVTDNAIVIRHPKTHHVIRLIPLRNVYEVKVT